VSIEKAPAPAYIAHALEVMENAPLYKLCRLRVIDEGPLALQSAYISAALCPGLEEHDLTNSLYQLLETRYGLRLWTGREILRAQPPTPREAELLQISKESPVMYIERITYAVTGVPVEYLESVWRGDRYDFKVTLSRP
jgi:GntR family transcriptional regulator